MATEPIAKPDEANPDPAPEPKFTPAAAMALFGGAVAVTAGAAYFGSRAKARRNRDRDGRPINSVMATAITACDVAPEKSMADLEEPPVPTEPKV